MFETDRISKRTALRKAEQDIDEIKAEKEKMERKRDGIDADLKAMVAQQATNKAYDTLVKNEKNIEGDINTLETDLAAVPSTDKKKITTLTNQIKDLRNDLKRLRDRKDKLSEDGKDYTSDIVTKQTDLQAIRDQITTNETAHKLLITARNDAQDEYDKVVAKIAKVDAKLATKNSGDISYADALAARTAAENAIDAADQAIRTQEAIIRTETQNLEVDGLVLRWATRMR